MAVAELDVQVDARERGAVGVDPGAVDVLLHQDLGREVGDLRAHHRQRVAAGAVAGADQQRVGHRRAGTRAAPAGVGRRPERVADRCAWRFPARRDSAERPAAAGGAPATTWLTYWTEPGVGQRDRLRDRLARLRQRLVGERLAVDGRRRLGVVGIVEAEEGREARVVDGRGLGAWRGASAPRPGCAPSRCWLAITAASRRPRSARRRTSGPCSRTGSRWTAGRRRRCRRSRRPASRSRPGSRA